MGYHNANCLICGGTTEDVHDYSDWECEHCGAEYKYREGHVLADSEIEKLVAAARPIPVSERLPELSVEVLAYHPKLSWVFGHLSEHSDGRRWYDRDGAYIGLPTHWLPLPPKPE